MSDASAGGGAEAKSPQDALKARLHDEWLARAVTALDEPLSPDWGLRCPRCGERLTKAGGETLTEAEKAEPANCPRCKVAPRSAEAGERMVPRSRNPIRELFRGATYIPRGLFRIVFSPRLWPYAIVPLLLNIAAVALAYVLASYVVVPWLDGVDVRWTEAGGVWWVLSYPVAFLSWMAQYLLPLIFAWLIVLPPFKIVYQMMFMPVMELLTEATERITLGFKDDTPFQVSKFISNIVIGILDALLLMILQIVVLIVLLPINLVPFVGSLVWAVVPPTVTAGMDFTDILLIRRGYPMREKIRLWWTYQWRFLGYGVTFFFFITIPVINCFVIPVAAVGGALLYLELDRK